MSTPNLKSLTTVHIGSGTLAVASTEAELVAEVSTGHAKEVTAVYVTNVHATSSGKVTLVHRKFVSSPPDDTRLSYNRAIPIKTTVNLLGGKSIYLDEGEALVISADLDNVLEADAPWLDMT